MRTKPWRKILGWGEKKERVEEEERQRNRKRERKGNRQRDSDASQHSLNQPSLKSITESLFGKPVYLIFISFSL